MRHLVLAAALTCAALPVARADVGFNVATYEQCASLFGAIAGEAPWAKTADWYREAGGAFVLAAAEERLRGRGEPAGSWLRVKVEAQAVQDSLAKANPERDRDLRQNPELLEFCLAIGEAIVPVPINAFKQN